MSEICGQCDKEVFPDKYAHIQIDEHTQAIRGISEITENFFCSWECVKLWVSDYLKEKEDKK